MGAPLVHGNPHAPLYPAGQQYTWVTNDVVVLQSISMRLPHQPGVFGAETVALTMASMFGMEEARMHQPRTHRCRGSVCSANPDEIVMTSVASPPPWTCESKRTWWKA